MHINFASSSSSLQGLSFNGGSQPPKEIQDLLKQSGISAPDQADFSTLGNFISSSNLSDSDLKDLQAFDQKVQDALQSGNFDAKSLAESAPDKLKSFAKDNGIDLEGQLNKVSDFANKLKSFASAHGYDSSGAPKGGFGGIGGKDATQSLLLALLQKSDDDDTSKSSSSTSSSSVSL